VDQASRPVDRGSGARPSLSRKNHDGGIDDDNDDRNTDTTTYKAVTTPII
jgi:hypothetical protein